MTTFCHMCGTQAIDDKSLFCTVCGTQLIQNIPEEKNEICPNCGTKILDKESVFCLWCGSPVSVNNSEVTTVSPGIGVKTNTREAEQSKEVSKLPAIDTVNLSHQSESQKSKSHKPLKRTSMVLPAIVLFILFVLILWMISQTGVLDSISSIGSITVSQEHMVVPANGTSTPTPTVTTSVTTTQAAMKNIVETAKADGRFTTLVAAVKAAELNDTLSDPGPFTVFAPTDDAFKNLSGSMDTLLKDPQGDLLQILLYHVVSGNLMAADLEKLTSVETLQAGSLPISVSNGTITVDGATVIITDIECSNGVIHMVDTVMLPPA